MEKMCPVLLDRHIISTNFGSTIYHLVFTNLHLPFLFIDAEKVSDFKNKLKKDVKDIMGWLICSNEPFAIWCIFKPENVGYMWFFILRYLLRHDIM